MKYYAGIGSRETPVHICLMMANIARKLEKLGYILRSGGAQGADQAFASGCTDKEIYVPWHDFQGLPMIFPIPQEAYDIASKIHPGWDHLKPAAKTMMARNTMQIQGADLRNNSHFVICWTPDGATCTKERRRTTGGTGQAIDLASRLGVGVFNLAKEEHLQRLKEFTK